MNKILKGILEFALIFLFIFIINLLLPNSSNVFRNIGIFILSIILSIVVSYFIDKYFEQDDDYKYFDKHDDYRF